MKKLETDIVSRLPTAEVNRTELKDKISVIVIALAKGNINTKSLAHHP